MNRSSQIMLSTLFKTSILSKSMLSKELQCANLSYRKACKVGDLTCACCTCCSAEMATCALDCKNLVNLHSQNCLSMDECQAVSKKPRSVPLSITGWYKQLSLLGWFPPCEFICSKYCRATHYSIVDSQRMQRQFHRQSFEGAINDIPYRPFASPQLIQFGVRTARILE